MRSLTNLPQTWLVTVTTTPHLDELFLMLSPHAFVSRHLFPHDVLLDVFAVLLAHNGRRADRGKVIGAWLSSSSTAARTLHKRARHY